MFTGLIQDIGTIVAIDKQGDWTLTIEAQKMPLDNVSIGASIACSGICLTLIEKKQKQFKVQVSQETLSKTTIVHWRTGGRVNLEPALRMGDELGGHMLSGHVDGVARVVDKKSEGDSLRFQFEVPHTFTKFLAPKGSAAIDGVSLTINDAHQSYFGVNIIPHTQQMTTLAALNLSDEANFEVDMIARYVDRIISSPQLLTATKPALKLI